MGFDEGGVYAGEVGDSVNGGEQILILVDGDVRVPECSYRKSANVTITFVGEGRRVTNIVGDPNRTLNHIDVHSFVVGEEITVKVGEGRRGGKVRDGISGCDDFSGDEGRTTPPNTFGFSQVEADRSVGPDEDRVV